MISARKQAGPSAHRRPAPPTISCPGATLDRTTPSRARRALGNSISANTHPPRSKRALSKVSAVRAGCLALAFAIAARPAVADPEWNTGVVLGVAGTGAHDFWSHTSFAGALRGDVLFGRSHASDL